MLQLCVGGKTSAVIVIRRALLQQLPGLHNREQSISDPTIGTKGANSLVLVHEALAVQVSQSRCQHAVDAGLGCKAVAHNHEAMANQNHLIELVCLLHEGGSGLQVGCSAG